MCPTKSRTSHSVQRVWTFQFAGSSTRSKNFFWSRRRTSRTVSLLSAVIGLTGATTALIASSPCSSPRGHLAVRAGPREGGDLDGRQVESQVFPTVLVLRRQLEAGAQLIGRLVDRETRFVGRDLEEHTAGLPEVDRVEVLVVDHGRHLAVGSNQGLTPGELVGVVARPPGDVVNCAG